MIRQHTGIRVFVAEPCHYGLDQSSQEIIDPTSDSDVFALWETNICRVSCEDPDPQSDTIRGDTGTGRLLKLPQKFSP
jgi:hypothetical protein